MNSGQIKAALAGVPSAKLHGGRLITPTLKNQYLKIYRFSSPRSRRGHAVWRMRHTTTALGASLQFLGDQPETERLNELIVANFDLGNVIQ